MLIKERSFLRVLDAANIIPWECDPQTWRFTYVGSPAERILGYPLDQWYEIDVGCRLLSRKDLKLPKYD